ncbi:TPA: hypothetical protein IHM11_002491 [Escherichia coli]|uniref:hypothetical protein n=1 Tax=Escherichia coli TaxID=562 RepID=UPI000BE92074|nr:hypothetical protein [Escherichia coli]EFG7836912.1 hypothetical protein [Escherichia coli]MBB9130987.1 hypothetical protein [Escherichia coli]TXQ88669.1 hypothetical protein FV308_02420 [Escherichia coli]HAO2828243.1 hypothetical protein [Escherichia coli]HAO2835847.1 hypothetical protein [Escherichia coli]
MADIHQITITLDMKDHVARSQEVLEELQRRVIELSPRVSEEDALRILLLDMTFDYLKAKSQAQERAE